MTSKSWTTVKDVKRKGKLIDKGYVYKLFKNPVFIGVAAYKGQHYPGEHEPIIDQALWDAVQALLRSGTPHAKGSSAPRETKALKWKMAISSISSQESGTGKRGARVLWDPVITYAKDSPGR